MAKINLGTDSVVICCELVLVLYNTFVYFSEYRKPLAFDVGMDGKLRHDTFSSLRKRPPRILEVRENAEIGLNIFLIEKCSFQ